MWFVCCSGSEKNIHIFDLFIYVKVSNASHACIYCVIPIDLNDKWQPMYTSAKKTSLKTYTPYHVKYVLSTSKGNKLLQVLPYINLTKVGDYLSIHQFNFKMEAYIYIFNTTHGEDKIN